MVLEGPELIDSGRVDFSRSQRSHLGPDIDKLSHQLGNIRARGAGSELSPKAPPANSGEVLRT